MTVHNLTRRKMLAGLGAVGLASAGAGLGTSALFSDSEVFGGNSITAGEIDLLVHWESTYIGASTDEQRGVIDGGVSQAYVYEDWKPLDEGNLEFCFELHTNPAYLWVCGELTANAENGVSDPEAASSLETDPEGETSGDAQSGELADAMDAVLSYCNPDGTVIGEITRGTLREVLATMAGGIALDSTATATNAGIATPGEQTPYEPSSGEGELTGPCLCLDLELESGNETQSDSVGFDVTFHAVQARNTDGTLNPCCVPVETELSTGVADWQVTFDGQTTAAQTVTSPNTGWYPNVNPDDPDIPAACDAEWVNVNGSGTSGGGGDYGYELTFEAPDHTSADNPCTLTGAFAADNTGSIALDGTTIATSSNTSTFSHFRDPVGFSTTVTTSGTHTLRADVFNSGGATGVFVCALLSCPCPGVT